MVLGIAKTIVNAGKLLGETKKLKVFVNQFDDGVKVIKSFDKETGELVKEIKKTRKQYRFHRQLDAVMFNSTNVNVFSGGKKIKYGQINHFELENNNKGHLSCLSKTIKGIDSSKQTEIYVFDPNKNQKGLRAVKSEIISPEEKWEPSYSMTMYGGQLNGIEFKNMNGNDYFVMFRNLFKDNIVGEI